MEHSSIFLLSRAVLIGFLVLSNQGFSQFHQERDIQHELEYSDSDAARDEFVEEVPDYVDEDFFASESLYEQGPSEEEVVEEVYEEANGNYDNLSVEEAKKLWQLQRQQFEASTANKNPAPEDVLESYSYYGEAEEEIGQPEYSEDLVIEEEFIELSEEEFELKQISDVLFGSIDNHRTKAGPVDWDKIKKRQQVATVKDVPLVQNNAPTIKDKGKTRSIIFDFLGDDGKLRSSDHKIGSADLGDVVKTINTKKVQGLSTLQRYQGIFRRLLGL